MRERFYGPYAESNGTYRVVVVGADGERVARSFASEAEASREIAKAREQSETRTVTIAVDEFLAAETARGLKASTTERQRYHLNRLLQLDEHGHHLLSWLTPTVAARLYLESQRGAVDTHRNGLSVARQWGSWLALKGWLRGNPFAAVKGRGRRKHGKPQLRLDEGRKLLTVMLERAGQGDQGAIAALGFQFLGLRSTELVDRVVRDVDDGARILWVDDAKCERSKRPVEIPEWLRPYFVQLTRDKLPGAPLFPARSGRARSRDWATDQVPRLCKLAGVPRVTPHGLRGMAATYANIGGGVAENIAAALGHDVTMTKTSYFDRKAIDVNQRAATLVLLQGGSK